MGHPAGGERDLAFHQTFGKKRAKRVFRHRRQIGHLLALASGCHGDIEWRAARIGDILGQAVGRGRAGHKVYQVLATNRNHQLYPSGLLLRAVL